MPYPQRSKLLKSIRQWKTKAKARRQENVALKKRVMKLTRSRDTWKKKAQASQRRFVELQAKHHRASQSASPKKTLPPPVIAIASHPSKPCLP